MKERPILFSAPMVRAILDGSKTQTRRVVKGADYFAVGWPCKFGDPCNDAHCLYSHADGKHLTVMRSPYGQPGDRVWVRETWAQVGSVDPGYLTYRATYPKCLPMHMQNVPADIKDAGYKWTPSIHMPRWASRIDLEITGVRVERLQDISEADAIAEGAPPSHRSIDRISREFGYKDFPRSWYAQLWDQINGPGSWDSNPWVWVIEIKQIKKATPEQLAYMLPCAQLQAQAQETFDIPHFLRKGKD
jgi:hypothetical protein